MYENSHLYTNAHTQILFLVHKGDVEKDLRRTNSKNSKKVHSTVKTAISKTLNIF